jgi:hypothetical protein
VSYFYLEKHLKEARGGDPEAALWLIRELHKAMREVQDSRESLRKLTPYIEMAFDERLVEYFDECFEKLLSVKGDDGKRVSADIALNLAGKGKRGPKTKASTAQRAFDLGMAVSMKYRENQSMKSDGSTGASPLDRAIETVAQEENAGIETVRDAYKKYKAMLRRAIKKGG